MEEASGVTLAPQFRDAIEVIRHAVRPKPYGFSLFR